MSKYSLLLNTNEWRKKREEILLAEQSWCQRCGYQQLLNNYKTFTAKIEEKIKFDIIEKTLNNKINIVKIQSVNFPDIYVKSSIESNYNLSKTLVVNLISNSGVKSFNPSLKEQTLNNFYSKHLFSNNSYYNHLFESISESHDINGQIIDPESIYLVESHLSEEFKRQKSLQVHHLCYRTNQEIWNQPNNEYMTLCNSCHRIVHENYHIPFYNENGVEFQLLTPCNRCGGLGRIESYKHVQNGICFKCNGNRYVS